MIGLGLTCAGLGLIACVGLSACAGEQRASEPAPSSSPSPAAPEEAEPNDADPEPATESDAELMDLMEKGRTAQAPSQPAAPTRSRPRSGACVRRGKAPDIAEGWTEVCLAADVPTKESAAAPSVRFQGAPMSPGRIAGAVRQACEQSGLQECIDRVTEEDPEGKKIGCMSWSAELVEDQSGRLRCVRVLADERVQPCFTEKLKVLAADRLFRGARGCE